MMLMAMKSMGDANSVAVIDKGKLVLVNQILDLHIIQKVIYHLLSSFVWAGLKVRKWVMFACPAYKCVFVTVHLTGCTIWIHIWFIVTLKRNKTKKNCNTVRILLCTLMCGTQNKSFIASMCIWKSFGFHGYFPWTNKRIVTSDSLLTKFFFSVSFIHLVCVKNKNKKIDKLPHDIWIWIGFYKVFYVCRFWKIEWIHIIRICV